MLACHASPQLWGSGNADTCAIDGVFAGTALVFFIVTDLWKFCGLTDILLNPEALSKKACNCETLLHNSRHNKVGHISADQLGSGFNA